MLEQKTITTNFKTPPPTMNNTDSNKAVSQPANQSEKEKHNDPEKLSKLWAEIMKHESLSDKIMNFLFHPFVLLGGLIVGIYFLSRGKKESALTGTQNITLLNEMKKLKKRNKKLQGQLDSLLNISNEELNQLPARKMQHKLTTGRTKLQTFFLD